MAFHERLTQWCRQTAFRRLLPRWQRWATMANIVTPALWTLSPEDRVLILAPHPDDESIGCGALLLTHPSQCTVVCLTNGGLGIPGMVPAEAALIRRKEFDHAMGQAGIIDFHWLDWPDGGVSQQTMLPKELDLKRFSHILIPNPLDQHPDHQALAGLLARTLTQTATPNLTIGFYEIWGTLSVPNAVILVSNSTAKRDLINVYASQIEHHNYADRILALHIYRGMLANLPMAEAYTLLSAQDFLKHFD